jgi:hypothetical protein
MWWSKISVVLINTNSVTLLREWLTVSCDGVLLLLLSGSRLPGAGFCYGHSREYLINIRFLVGMTAWAWLGWAPLGSRIPTLWPIPKWRSHMRGLWLSWLALLISRICIGDGCRWATKPSLFCQRVHASTTDESSPRAPYWFGVSGEG